MEKLPHVEGVSEAAERIAQEEECGHATVERAARFAETIDQLTSAFGGEVEYHRPGRRPAAGE